MNFKNWSKSYLFWYNVVSKVDLSQYIPEEVTQCPPPGRMVKS